MNKYLLAAAGVVAVGGGAFLAYAWHPEIPPISPPDKSAFTAEAIKRGEVIAGQGYCAACHTVPGEAPLAGGKKMETPFGALFSANITPNTTYGVGSYSYEAFERAFRGGVRRDGALMYPAHTYGHFSKTTDEDVKALYAFIMTRAPADSKPPANTVIFPANIRMVMAGWNLFNFWPGRYQPDPSKSAEWNRGAYLGEGLGHCSACHTPRNLMMAEKSSDKYAGAAVDGWFAPPLTAANPSPAGWSQAQLAQYLRHGVAHAHGVANGPMAEVRNNLAFAPDSDIQALAVYYADVAQRGAKTDTLASHEQATARAIKHGKMGLAFNAPPEARLYADACGACHYNSAQLNDLRPDMAFNTTLYLDDPANFIRAVLDGVSAVNGVPGISMPAFRYGLSDADIVRIANFLRVNAAGKPEWPDLERKVRDIRKKTDVPPPPPVKSAAAQ